MKSRINAFGFAINGIFVFFKEGLHPKIHLLAAISVTILGVFVGLNTLEWGLIMLCFALVFGLEALNSSIEYICDLVSPEYHELVKKAKDVAAGAVLFVAFFSAIVGLLIFLPKL